MSDINQFSLFGVDLTVLYQRAWLGVKQLFLGREAGIKARFSDDTHLTELDALVGADDVELDIDTKDLRVAIPEAQVLLTALTLPASAEIYLDQAVSAHVFSCSPFPLEDASWGSCIVGRSDDGVALEIAIVSVASADRVKSLVLARFPELQGAISLWARTESGEVPLSGYENRGPQQRYLLDLRRYALRLLGGLVGLFFLCCLPPIWISQNAHQYENLLARTEERAQQVVRVRQALVTAQAQLSGAKRYFSANPDYRQWLHKIAELAPDSVYLNRLSIKGNQLTVSGFAENAAEYQSTLVQSELFSNVNAPSAFTLDKRADRERFTLTMEIALEDQP